MTALPPLTPADHERYLAKSAQSPLGPGLHWVNLRNEAGRVTVRTPCSCRLKGEHDEGGEPETYEWSLGGPVRPSEPIAAPAPPSGEGGAVSEPLAANLAMGLPWFAVAPIFEEMCREAAGGNIENLTPDDVAVVRARIEELTAQRDTAPMHPSRRDLDGMGGPATAPDTAEDAVTVSDAP